MKKESQSLKLKGEIKMRKVLAVVLAISLTLATIGVSLAFTTEENVEILDARLSNAVVVALDANLALVNGRLTNVDENRGVAPYIDSADRTKVPLRFITEAFGVTVTWDNNSQTATIWNSLVDIRLVEGANSMTVNGEIVTLDSEIRSHHYRLFVPLRAIAEALQKEVFFDRGLIIISNIANLFDADTDREILDEISDILGVIPTVGNIENFERILEEIAEASTQQHRGSGWDIAWENDDMFFGEVMPMPLPAIAPPTTGAMPGGGGGGALFDMAASESAPTLSAPQAMPELGAGSDDFSGTNVQVEGVDEADVVKTDGELIYYLRSNGELVISRAFPYANMEVLQRLRISGFSPREMYVDGDDLVLIGFGGGATQIYVYSIMDVLVNANNAIPRIITVEGEYLSSRKIGGNVYVTTNKHIWNWHGMPTPELPFYSDRVGIATVEPTHLNFNQIRCFPNPQSMSYLIVAAFNIHRPDQPVNVSAYIGAGEDIYMSRENMFVARGQRDFRRGFGTMDGGGEYTVIYRFGLGDGRLTFSGSGRVEGTILNQWAMDEFRGYFRIATTRDWVNFVFVLNGDLEVVGEIRDIAPTERIYSARFMGEKLYMVTFFIVDPFFVICLADPYNPEVLGELKIPGYSDYLHPFDDNLIIGFGQDTIESGNVAFDQGMKMSMFDVSDVNDPIELFTISIGGRGTTSELLRNHRALLFCRERNIIAFPATVFSPNDDTNPWSSGQFEFQGGLVYSVDLEANAFVLRGVIKHGEGNRWNSATDVRRMLYIGDIIYGMSDFGITAHNLTDISEINRIVY